ncbi:MAG: LysR family transcriptional regulator, partial [Alcaligenaceae bacterium]
LEVRLHTSASPPDFDNEDLDAAVVLNHGQYPGLVQYKIMENEISPVCTPSMAARLISPESLMGETLLHTDARPDDWKMWFTQVGQSLPGASRDMRFQSSALAYEAALAGFGVAMGQKALIIQELIDGRLVAPFEQWVNLKGLTYYFVLSKRSYESNSRQAVVFRQWIESISLSDPIVST